MKIERDWTLLMIGGAQLTGKSTLAVELGKRLDLRVLEADLFSMVIHRALPKKQQPGFKFFGHREVWDLPPEELASRLVQFACGMCNFYEIVVANQLLKHTPTVLEGPSLLPEFAVQENYAMERTREPRADVKPGQIRSLFLYEPDEAAVAHRLRERPSSRATQSPSPELEAKVLYLYGLEIKAQAEALGIPVLESRPFDTLLDRALVALGEPSSETER